MRRSTTDDVVALGQLNAAYADVITRRAFNELGELLLPDCVVHLDLVSAPARDLVGPEALAGMLRSALERFDHFMLVIRNSVVEADVDESGVVERATGACSSARSATIARLAHGRRLTECTRTTTCGSTGVGGSPSGTIDRWPAMRTALWCWAYPNGFGTRADPVADSGPDGDRCLVGTFRFWRRRRGRGRQTGRGWARQRCLWHPCPS